MQRLYINSQSMYDLGQSVQPSPVAPISITPQAGQSMVPMVQIGDQLVSLKVSAFISGVRPTGETL